MTTHSEMFLNLAVTDLAATRAFWTGLGYRINEKFSDDNALCLVLGDSLFAMLLTHEYFRTFTDKAVIDATTSTETLTALSIDSREAVDRLVDAAVAAGATEPRPAQDLGFMYSRGFGDLDGHHWDILWMDPAAV